VAGRTFQQITKIHFCAPIRVREIFHDRELPRGLTALRSCSAQEAMTQFTNARSVQSSQLFISKTMLARNRKLTERGARRSPTKAANLRNCLRARRRRLAVIRVRRYLERRSDSAIRLSREPQKSLARKRRGQIKELQIVDGRRHDARKPPRKLKKILENQKLALPLHRLRSLTQSRTTVPRKPLAERVTSARQRGKPRLKTSQENPREIVRRGVLQSSKRCVKKRLTPTLQIVQFFALS
jgi:hypothetical protein